MYKRQTWNIAANKHPDLAAMSNVIAENNIEVLAVQEVDMFNNRNNLDMMAGLTSAKLAHTDFAKFRNYEMCIRDRALPSSQA